ncbi:MAG: hypothetical protein JOZ72_09825 [Alphaproteobacteria bacterium]|nr:hypothetical protein [Alphaproteobacteria bacterium]
MMKMSKGAGSVLALFAMMGQSWAGAMCAKPDEAMALKTAAMQQELMVAALYCNDVAPYNHFVTSHQHELQASDAMLLSYFQRGHGGSPAYHAYKTGLANDFSLTGLHGMQRFCAAANASFDAERSGPGSLASFISTQDVRGTEAYPSCDTTTAAGGEMVTGGSTRLAASRRN